MGAHPNRVDCRLRTADCRFLDCRFSIEIDECGLRLTIVDLAPAAQSPIDNPIAIGTLNPTSSLSIANRQSTKSATFNPKSAIK
jgi:hypothetical protein